MDSCMTDHDVDTMGYHVDTMAQVGIRELKQNTSAVIRRVIGGEVMDVTDHGHLVARIVPLHPSVLDQMVAEGRATAARGRPLDVMEELGLPLAPEPGVPLPSEILAEMRAGER
jgi:antitoxin (DNA-binding transcriptional repressor) of toxin-antitoxin stability system